MKKLLLLLYCILTSLCSPAYADELFSIVNSMQTAYAQMKGFRADFNQELFQNGSGVSEQRKGSIAFQKPLLLRWETDFPHPELFMVTETEIWNYLADEKLAYCFSRQMAEDSRSLIQVITGQSSLMQNFDIEAAPQNDEKGILHILLYPKEPTTEFTEAQLWIDIKNSLILKIMVIDFYGNTNTITLKNLKPNPDFSKTEFQFSPPEDTEIEDHREQQHPVQQTLQN